jgi:toxin YoeB
MRKLWGDEAWDDYLYWQSNNKKIAAKINELIKSIEREGTMKGLGKPEPLRHRKGYSRRITDEDRLTYDVSDGILYIYSCRGHYEY